MAALVAGAPLPSGFDVGTAAAVVDVLRAKRRRAMAHAAPELPALLGTGWPDLFRHYAATRVVTGGTSALDDAVSCCRWLLTLPGRPRGVRALMVRLRCRQLVLHLRRTRQPTASEGVPSGLERHA